MDLTSSRPAISQHDILGANWHVRIVKDGEFVSGMMTMGVISQAGETQIIIGTVQATQQI